MVWGDKRESGVWIAASGPWENIWEGAEGGTGQAEDIPTFLPASPQLLPILPALGNPANEASVAQKCTLAQHTSL